MSDNEIFEFAQPEAIDKKERLGFRLFFFISFYVLLNYFVLSELYLFIGAEKDYLFSFLLVFLSLSYVLGAAALRYSNSFFALFANVIGSAWLGTMVISVSAFLFVEVLYFFNLVSFEGRSLLAFSLILVFVVYSLLNAVPTKKKFITLKSSKISKPFTLVQVSDLHVGAAHKRNFLNRIIKKVNSENPDVVVITGDLIDGKHVYEDHYFDSLKDLKGRVLMVTGNHERMTGMGVVNHLLKDSGVVLLRNMKVSVGDFNFVGVDDTEKSRKLIGTLNNLSFSSKKFNVLLFHRPKRFKKVCELGFDLMLSGHTHAGQIFPMNILQMFYYSKVKGLKKYRGSYLYVSPGTGWWGPPMRLGSNNEITVFKFLPDKK